MAEFRQYYELSPGAAVMYQITSTQTIKAFIVMFFLILTGFLFVAGRDVPPELWSVTLIIVGSYFDVIQVGAHGNDRNDTTRN